MVQNFRYDGLYHMIFDSKEYLIIINEKFWFKMVQNFRYDGLYHVIFDSQEYMIIINEKF